MDRIIIALRKIAESVPSKKEKITGKGQIVTTATTSGKINTIHWWHGSESTEPKFLTKMMENLENADLDMSNMPRPDMGPKGSDNIVDEVFEKNYKEVTIVCEDEGSYWGYKGNPEEVKKRMESECKALLQQKK